MSDTLFSLRLDHRNFATLLEILETQLERLNQADDVDCELIGSVVDYLRSYGDQCHHPKEDLVYRALSRRNPGAAAAIGDLSREHEELAKISDTLARELEAVGQGKARAVRLKLKSPLTDYLEFYRRHLAMEEARFFPAALSELSEEDWAVIDFDTFDRDDPLFSDVVEKRFERLRAEIAARSR